MKPGENAGKTETQLAKRKTGSVIYLLAMVSVLGLAVWAHWSNRTAKDELAEGAKVWGDPESQELQEIFNQKVEGKFLKYSNQNLYLEGEFEKSLREILERNFTQAEKAIPAVTKKLSSFGACNKLCCKLVKDKVKGTQDTQAAIQSELESVNGPCQKGVTEVNDLLETFRQQLLENSNDFRSSVAEELESQQFEPISMKLKESFHQAEAAAVSLTTATLTAEVGTALELLFIRQTYRVISAVLLKPAGRIIAAGTTGAVCAAADGPIPVGDAVGAVIALLGAAWTTYDIYQVKQVLPAQMKETLQESVGSSRSELEAKAKARAKELLKTFADTNKELKDKIFSTGGEP